MSGNQNHPTTKSSPDVIPFDYQEHTLTHPFCSADASCPCHEDLENIAEVNNAYRDGFLTQKEATNIVNGKTL